MGLTFFGDSTLGTARAWLDGLSRRQQAISNNIANIDTPGYQAQEVPFEAELRRQLGMYEGGLTTTDPRHIPVSTHAANQLGLQQAQLLTSQRLDQNNVDIDAEMIELAETQMRYQAAASALTTQIDIIRNAIGR
ncbi:MAG: flagellar basal body rod protein FlgB [Ignavibacteriales bacterium]